MPGKEIIRRLEQLGSKILRVSRSHRRMGKDNLRTTIPVHVNRDIGKGLLAEIEGQTGVKLK